MKICISVSKSEYAKHRLSEDNLEHAARAIRKAGFVVAEGIVRREILRELAIRMDRDASTLIAEKRWGGAGHLKGHLQLGPPLGPPHVHKDILANPFIIQITRKVLGDRIFNTFYNGNTNCPGSVIQPLHRDGPVLWPGLASHPTTQLVVNIGTQDVTLENGAIELWPGSHLNTESTYPIDQAAEELQRSTSPPVSGCTELGSVLIRDIRLWHRGVPNLSARPRHMIAMIHTVGWYRRGKPLLFEKGCEDAFPDQCGLDHKRYILRGPPRPSRIESVSTMKFRQ